MRFLFLENPFIFLHVSKDFSITRLKVVCTCGGGRRVLADAQLDTLKKIPYKFQLNPSSRLGGVVVTGYFHFLRLND